ncbi:hypothetical protein NADFUDRAFT_80780 [Nadsonia fulvescens var. elongata DSM 6958]|uniref:Genetic interactor of prohibitins 3, mitochondrial n=1 Tax=Nadsonia fulvescens var. elongata DSM 6958 TaxID=857566 RepID=A0A1E3PDM0_9ASCO|nr:hypothetical protein NADFUDRAFT_80780 [Nadsonia fulvescens var. elongata DSM 6958]
MLNIIGTQLIGSTRVANVLRATRALKTLNTIKKLQALRSVSTLKQTNEKSISGSDSSKMAAGLARAIALSSETPSTGTNPSVVSSRVELANSSGVSTGLSTHQGASGIEVAKLGSPRCPSCGTKFQSQTPALPGYVSGGLRLDRRHAQRKQIAYRNPKDIAYEKLLNSIPNATKQILEDMAPQHSVINPEIKYIEAVNDANYVKKKTPGERTEDIAKELLKKHDICQRCHDIKYQPLTDNTTLISNYARNEVILNSIPQEATMVHIMDGSDFPASIYNNIITRADQVKDIIWVINKADKLVNEKFKAQERVHDWAVAELSHHLQTDIDPNNVYIVSQKTKWHTKRLFHRLSKRNYFIGYTNSGKTSLILTLLKEYAAQDKRQRNILASHARGISFVPGMTQETLKYTAGPIAIYDMPGFEEPHHGIHQWIKPSLMAEVVAGRPWFKKLDFVNSSRLVIRPGHCLSVGGGALVELPVDEDSDVDKVVLIAWTNIKDEKTFNHVFTTKKKALDRIENPLGAAIATDTSEGLDSITHNHLMEKKRSVDRFFVKPITAKNYKLVETPVHVGAAGLEIAILGLGTLRLKIHGQIPEKLRSDRNGFKVNVWVPRDTKAVIRKYNLIERVFTRRNNSRMADFSLERSHDDSRSNIKDHHSKDNSDYSNQGCNYSRSNHNNRYQNSRDYSRCSYRSSRRDRDYDDNHGNRRGNRHN